jgi:hypothetical protein
MVVDILASQVDTPNHDDVPVGIYRACLACARPVVTHAWHVPGPGRASMCVWHGGGRPKSQHTDLSVESAWWRLQWPSFQMGNLSIGTSNDSISIIAASSAKHLPP